MDFDKRNCNFVVTKQNTYLLGFKIFNALVVFFTIQFKRDDFVNFDFQVRFPLKKKEEEEQ